MLTILYSIRNNNLIMNVKILNEFGIKPSNTYVSAGADFYIPNISKEKAVIALKAFEKSYNVSNDDINTIVQHFSRYVKVSPKDFDNNIANLVHLYLGLYSYTLNELACYITDAIRVKLFVDNYLIFNKDNIPGIQLKPFDQVLINSGIRVALEHDTAGIFFNKSGKGNAGFDVRAQVVDEDYTGFVHLSLQYTKQYTEDNKNMARIFCGDKLSQMVILPIKRMDAEEITKEEYDRIMSDSQRGSNSFGSSDVKH